VSDVLGGRNTGDTVFIEPRFVIGTPKMGFSVYKSFKNATARAMFMMFMISEVHPFVDGNERVARIMMNSELVSSGTTQVVIPTVFRDDYLLGLRRLSRQMDPKVYVHMLKRAHEFSHWLEPEDFDTLMSQLEASNAFKEPDEDRGNLKWD
jgi:Fic family protein